MARGKTRPRPPPPKWGAKAVNGTGEGKRASSRARARAGCRSHQPGHAAGTPWGQGTYPHHPAPEDDRATGASPSPFGQGTRSSSLHRYCLWVFFSFPVVGENFKPEKKPVSKRCEVVLMLSVCHLEREIFFWHLFIFHPSSCRIWVGMGSDPSSGWKPLYVTQFSFIYTYIVYVYSVHLYLHICMYIHNHIHLQCGFFKFHFPFIF